MTSALGSDGSAAAASVGCAAAVSGGAVGSGVGTGVAVGAGVDVGTSVAVGAGVFVGMGAGVSVGVGSGVFVAVGAGTGVFVGITTGCGVAVAVGSGDGVSVGVGSSTLAEVNTISRDGRLLSVECSRLSNRLAVVSCDSVPFISQPKLLAASSSQAWTSAAICSEVQEYEPSPPTFVSALASRTKSPPACSQFASAENVCTQGGVAFGRGRSGSLLLRSV